MHEQASTSFSSCEQEAFTHTPPKPAIQLTPSMLIGWRPRVLFAFVAEECVLHFADIRGRQFKIKNANEAQEYICKQLRGAITVADVLASTRSRYPDTSEKAIYRLLNLLIERALVEEKNILPSSAISIEDMQRYDRQLRFFGLFADTAQDRFRMQDMLTQATVTVIGLGGVGNWVTRHLAAMGIGYLRLVDHDVVERSNLNRQALYTPADLAKPKVEVAATALKAFNPHLEVQAIPLKISSPEDIERVVEGATIAVLTADKPMIEIRRWMAVACARKKRPYIQGSLDAYNLQIGPLYCLPYTGCYFCRENILKQEDRQAYAALAGAYERSPREKAPLVGPLCGFVGSAVALEVVRYINRYQPPCTLGRYYIVDARTWTTESVIVPHNETCPVCSTSAEMCSDQSFSASAQASEGSSSSDG